MVNGREGEADRGNVHRKQKASSEQKQASGRSQLYLSAVVFSSRADVSKVQGQQD
jgi:hypothetical protein